MKKLLAICMTAILTVAGTAGITAVAAASEAQEETAQVYLVPGRWRNNSTKQYENNTIEGLTALPEEEQAALNMETAVYPAGEAGSELPTPTTTQTGRTFNGWWTVVNAEVKYFETVPEVTETTYLYADFRAALSQPQDPVLPDPDAEEEITDYILCERSTGEVEKIPLFVSGTDVPNAVGSSTYGGPVQLYNEWFTLYEGDIISIYCKKLLNRPEPTVLPVYYDGHCNMQLESNPGVNATSSWLEFTSGSGVFVSNGNEKTMRCKVEHIYRVYIKCYDQGGTTTVYMEPQDK